MSAQSLQPSGTAGPYLPCEMVTAPVACSQNRRFCTCSSLEPLCQECGRDHTPFTNKAVHQGNSQTERCFVNGTHHLGQCHSPGACLVPVRGPANNPAIRVWTCPSPRKTHYGYSMDVGNDVLLCVTREELQLGTGQVSTDRDLQCRPQPLTWRTTRLCWFRSNSCHQQPLRFLSRNARGLLVMTKKEPGLKTAVRSRKDHILSHWRSTHEAGCHPAPTADIRHSTACPQPPSAVGLLCTQLHIPAHHRGALSRLTACSPPHKQP